MTTRTFRLQWVPREESRPEPVDTARKKALRLPRPGPGITVNVHLSLAPDYLDIYNLVPMSLGEVRDMEKALHMHKPAGVLWVKRVAKEKPDEQTKKR